MDDRTFERVGAISAAAVGVLSVVYAIAYLGITPAAQRGSDVDKSFSSYLAHPAGLRIASVCLLVSGVLTGLAVVAITGRLRVVAGRSLTWAAIAGAAAGLVTATHGLGDLVGLDKLAHRYANGDAGVRAAVVTVHALPSPVDPRGLVTFGVAGLVALALGLALRRSGARLGMLGIVLGADLVLLFVATAVGINALVLLTGGLASVILGPAWWLGIAQLLWRDRPAV